MSGTAPEPREVAPEKQETWWKRNHTYFWWGLLAFAAGLSGMLGILAFAKITFLPAAPPWWPIKVAALDKVAHGQVVNAAVSWFVGTIALYTFYVNVSQKERHHKALEERERELAAKEREQTEKNEREREQLQRELAKEQRDQVAKHEEDRLQLQKDLAQELRNQTATIEREREKRERDLAELQRLEAEFAALADDFAQPEPLARINAAIGLGELARRPDPRRVAAEGTVMFDPREDTKTWIGDNGEILDEPRPWPKDWTSLKTERNYPYFMRAAHRLAAALYMWEDAPARAQAVRVLSEMGAWAKDVGKDEPLLHALANALAEANRTAWSQLKEKTGLCLVADESVDLPIVLGLHLPDEASMNKRFLERKRLAHGAFVADLLANIATIPAVVVSTTQKSTMLIKNPNSLKELQIAGQTFWATRDALATALRQLSPHPDAPKTEHPRNRHWYDRDSLKKRRGLKLKQVQLVEANLFQANMAGVECEWAHFEGADLWGADLRKANLYQARFVGANCRGATLTEASCISARLEDSNCYSVSFADADLSYAYLDRADCSGADLSGAMCYGAKLDATQLFGTHMGQRKGPEPIGLERTNWYEGNFQEEKRHPLLQKLNSPKEYDKELWTYLNETYPVEEGQPARVPPWEKDKADEANSERRTQGSSGPEIEVEENSDSNPETSDS